ncbi:MAG: SDR family NAD(P)-dependent oxidoreductase [Cyclobacteriaceae bacterium]|nr:SDR family NAD(P)-dependent oxidoreductase [Cyclobacteriaceae bacterium]
MSKTVFITGATSGIGQASAEIFAQHKYRLIVCGRREDRLKELRERLKASAQVEYLVFDVRDRDEVFKQINSLPEDFKKIDILINNAGNAHGFNSIDEGKLDDWDAMIDINVKGLLYVSKAIIPGMIERKSGHIINIGSVAGKEVYVKGNVYCASKFAVDAISTGMRIDLNEHGIKVSEVNPGAVDTEFSEVRFKGDKEKFGRVYDGFKPLAAEDIADIIYFVATRPAHVNIADSLILPISQASATIINRSGN